MVRVMTYVVVGVIAFGAGGVSSSGRSSGSTAEYRLCGDSIPATDSVRPSGRLISVRCSNGLYWSLTVPTNRLGIPERRR